MKILRIALLSCMVLGLAAATSDAKPRKRLEKGDVKRFCKTFPTMVVEYQKLGFSYDPKTGRVKGMRDVKAAEDAAEILDENGWDKAFFTKMQTIIDGYALLRCESILEKDAPKIAKAVEKVEKAKRVSKEKKQEVRNRAIDGHRRLEKTAKRLRRKVHESDLKRIESHMSKLAVVFNDKGYRE